VTTAIPEASPSQIEQITTAIKTHLAQAEETITPATPSPGQIAAVKAKQKAEKSLQKAADSITEAQAKLTQPPPQPEAAEPEPDPEPTPTVETAVSPSQTQILTLLKDGKITVEQANILLDQLPKT
jgi:hypothetical protein